ncbi:MAG: SusD/RagB family nutrient-binding outer membrane lipoprotein, partial [Bacteroides sp.]
MKKNKSIIRFVCLGLLASATACTSNFEKYNTNPYDANDQEMGYDGYKMRSALTSMQGWVIPLDVNTTQFTECLLGGSYGGYLADSNNG